MQIIQQQGISALDVSAVQLLQGQGSMLLFSNKFYCSDKLAWHTMIILWRQIVIKMDKAVHQKKCGQ